MGETLVVDPQQMQYGGMKVSDMIGILDHIEAEVICRPVAEARFDASGEVIGIAGAMYRIEEPKELSNYFQERLPVVNYIEKNFDGPISMVHLAKFAGLSKTHFNRRFRQLLRMSPTEYLRSVRVQSAQIQLSNSSPKLAVVESQMTVRALRVDVTSDLNFCCETASGITIVC